MSSGRVTLPSVNPRSLLWKQRQALLALLNPQSKDAEGPNVASLEQSLPAMSLQSDTVTTGTSLLPAWKILVLDSRAKVILSSQLKVPVCWRETHGIIATHF